MANISDARGLGISIGRLVALDLFWICGACIFLVFRRLRSRWLLGIVRIFLFLGPDGCLSYRLSYCLAGLVGSLVMRLLPRKFLECNAGPHRIVQIVFVDLSTRVQRFEAIPAAGILAA